MDDYSPHLICLERQVWQPLLRPGTPTMTVRRQAGVAYPDNEIHQKAAGHS